MGPDSRSVLNADHPLLAVSRRYGADPAFVLAGGGNTSFKQGDRLWVKGSGHALATIGVDGFVELDRNKLEGMLDADWPENPTDRESLFVERILASRVHPELAQRPSVESLLHHLIPEALVVHTHPGLVNAVTCCQKGQAIAAQLFGDDVLWQAYVDPGLILARSLGQLLATWRATRHGRPSPAILLQNHGLIVSGDNASAIEGATDRLTSAIRSKLAGTADLNSAGLDAPSDELLQLHASVVRSLHPALDVVADQSTATRWLARTAPGHAAAMAGPLTPDQIVYCRSLPLWIERPASQPDQARQQWQQAWAAYERVHGFGPWVGLVEGAGVLTFRDGPKLAEVSRAVYADAAQISADAYRLGGVCHLSGPDRKFIEEWEVEAHRRSVLSQSA